MSRTDTPIDGVEARLTGSEQAGSDVSGRGGYGAHTHVDLLARTSKAMLTPGEHRFKFRFELAAGSPPAYATPSSRVLYDLQIRVDIPWWPDRTGRFLVPVVAAPSGVDHAPAVFCTDARGPHGTGLYIEASLDTASIPRGGMIRGAVSIANVQHHRVRKVELALVQLEVIGVNSIEARRYVVTLVDAAPEDGRALPFQVNLPADAPTSFRAALFEARWYLEVRAVVSLATDTTLRVPFTVYRSPGGAAPEGLSQRRVPPVGKSRRALMWAEIAHQHHMRNDAEAERMALEVGDVAIAITLEPRKSGGLALTASVTWPDLGLDLAVTERRWVDGWSGRTTTIDAPEFAARFTCRGREDAQVRAFLREVLCDFILRFDEAAIDDEGATLVSATVAQSAAELGAFVALATRTAQAIDDARAAIPPPASMADAVPAWRSFAATLGGRFSVTDMSIRDAAFDDSTLSVETLWTEAALPRATRIRFPLPEREGAAASEARPIDAASRAIIQSLEAKVSALHVTEQAVEATLIAPITDPATLEPLLAGLGELTRRVTGGASRGPYR